ncbi:MAG: phytoene/squalene synthase family protein [Gammaproteobacteria bacterium]|nr:phytoene/squalene synthase family protein [Gammaproteobacteria bacterium]
MTAKLASAEDLESCRESIRVGSKTFHAASFLLPQRVREPALALYAFCREADDAIDQSDDPQRAWVELNERLDRLYRGEPIDRAADRAMADVVTEFLIPQAVPAALLEGFAWDAAGRRYEDFRSLQDYAVRVAGTVGIMMSLLMGVRAPWALARAADLGIAMQLSNIARDVGEDARMGRVYLPEDWLREANSSREALLAAPVFSQSFRQVVDRLVHAAETLYVRAAAGVTELPPECRPAIHAARLMYAEIGREVMRRSGDSISQRAVVSGRRKALLLAKAISVTAIASSPQHKSWPVMPAAVFLLDAIATHDAAKGIVPDPTVAESILTRDLMRLLGVIERIESQELAGLEQTT